MNFSTDPNVCEKHKNLINSDQNEKTRTMFGAAILIAVVTFAIWRKCCAQAQVTAPAPAIAAPLPTPPPQIQTQPAVQPQMPIPQQAPPAYTQQNPTFNFSKPTAPVLIYT
jgi:hypothetical protein